MDVEDFFSLNPPDVLVFRLEDRRQIINDFYKTMENLFPWLTRYVEDVEHAREIGLESSVVSHLTYNLLLTISKATKGLNTYEYIRSQYLLDDEYDKAYEIWLEFVEKTKKIKDLINSIDCHYFDDDVDIYEFVNSIIPPNLNNIEGFDIDLSKTDMERIELDSADLVGYLVMANTVGEGLLKCLKQKLRNMEGWLCDLKNGLYLDREENEDYDYTYQLNYNLYKKEYWPHEGANFRTSLSAMNFYRPVTQSYLEEQRQNEMRDFVTNPTGQLWRDFHNDKKALYMEIKNHAKLDEERWKYFFKQICRFEEYERWIEELNNPQSNEKYIGNSDSTGNNTQINTGQKIAAFFNDGTLKVEKPHQLYFLLLAMWARHLLSSKEMTSFVRTVRDAYPAIYKVENDSDWTRIVTSLQNMNGKANKYFDEVITDQATMIEYIDMMYPRKKDGERRKEGQNAVDLANILFLGLK